MILRKMQKKDLEQVVRIEKENFSTPWKQEDFSGWLDREEGLFLAAEEEGNVIGYCGVILTPPEGDITNVSVSTESRGKGVGRALVEEMLKLTEQMGISKLFLEVRTGNVTAAGLYRSVGFRDMNIRKNYYENPREDALIMMRDVSEPDETCVCPGE